MTCPTMNLSEEIKTGERHRLFRMSGEKSRIQSMIVYVVSTVLYSKKRCRDYPRYFQLYPHDKFMRNYILGSRCP